MKRLVRGYQARSWCPHCVRGGGKDLDHRKAMEEDRRIREFSFGYCFPGDEKGGHGTSVVQVNET